MKFTAMKLGATGQRFGRFVMGGAAALVMTASAALALTAQDVIDDLAAQGFTRIEVRVGPTQIKAEGIRGTEKVEIIYDSASGTVLKTETSAVGADDSAASGISVRDGSRDFVKVIRRSAQNDDDSNDDHHQGGSDSSASDDDGTDDHNGSGSDDSNDDAEDDDHGSGHGGSGHDDSSDHDSGDDHGSDDHGDDD